MKKFIILFFCMVQIHCFSQNIKCETADYSKRIDGKEYSTYNYIQASYSSSRPLIVMVANKEVFTKIYLKIPSLFSVKQEYTDVNLLGINDFNKNNISETDKKIIDTFINGIIKYRIDHNLPVYTEEQIKSRINYLDTSEDINRLFIVRKRGKKK